MSELAADDLDFGLAEAPEPPGTGVRPPLAGERTISPVAGRFGTGRSGKALAVLGLVAGCGVFLAATWRHPRSAQTRSGPQEPARQVVDWESVKGAGPTELTTSAAAPNAVSAPPASAPTLADPGAGAPSLSGAPGEGQVVPALAPPAGAAGSASGGARAVDAQAAAAQQARLAQADAARAIRSAPILAYSADVHASAAADPLLPAARRAAEAASASELDDLRRGSAIGLVHAQRLPDRDFLLTAGALLPCVLETAIDSSAPGFVTCRIARDIYSDSGGVVLMEKGSRVLGEYRSGFSQGHARIFVLWDRITTPGGVAVDVSSPASDALGRAGFDGRIDSHFWRRFGGALLLTTVGGGISAAATADARFASVAQAPNEAAAVALQNSINIAPTLTKPQGAEVGVFVSRDLDFSSVYALRGR